MAIVVEDDELSMSSLSECEEVHEVVTIESEVPLPDGIELPWEIERGDGKVYTFAERIIFSSAFNELAAVYVSTDKKEVEVRLAALWPKNAEIASSGL